MCLHASVSPAHNRISNQLAWTPHLPTRPVAGSYRRVDGSIQCRTITITPSDSSGKCPRLLIASYLIGRPRYLQRHPLRALRLRIVTGGAQCLRRYLVHLLLCSCETAMSASRAVPTAPPSAQCITTVCSG